MLLCDSMKQVLTILASFALWKNFGCTVGRLWPSQTFSLRPQKTVFLHFFITTSNKILQNLNIWNRVLKWTRWILLQGLELCPLSNGYLQRGISLTIAVIKPIILLGLMPAWQRQPVTVSTKLRYYLLRMEEMCIFKKILYQLNNLNIIYFLSNQDFHEMMTLTQKETEISSFIKVS